MNFWVSIILGVAPVMGLVIVIWCSYTAVWIKSIAVSLMKIAARRGPL
jgi:hypothetical protein